MNNRELAERIREVLPEEEWWDGCKVKREGQLCLGMAVNLVCRSLPLRENASLHQAVRDIADRLFPGRSTHVHFAATYHPGVPAFNDHPDTTYEDILLVLKHLEET